MIDTRYSDTMLQRRSNAKQGLAIAVAAIIMAWLVVTTPHPAEVPTGPGFDVVTDGKG